MAMNAVSWVEIYVNNMDRAIKFYQEVLGVELTKMEVPMPDVQMYMFPWVENAEGSGAALIKMPMRSAGDAGSIVYFSSEDCSELQKVESAGGKVVKAVESAGGMGHYCIFSDSEGNTVGLYSKN